MILRYSANCRACGWRAEGPRADTLADKHTRSTGHPTVTRLDPE